MPKGLGYIWQGKLKLLSSVVKYLYFQNMFAKDESGAYNLLPIKEQCGVTDPYVISYGKEAGTMRDFTWADTCACVKNPREFRKNSKE